MNPPEGELDGVADGLPHGTAQRVGVARHVVGDRGHGPLGHFGQNVAQVTDHGLGQAKIGLIGHLFILCEQKSAVDSRAQVMTLACFHIILDTWPPRPTPLHLRGRPLGLGRTLRDRVRRFAELAATPLVPADYLDVFNPLRAGADLRGRIEEIHPETADAATIVIRPGADWAGHVPGPVRPDRHRRRRRPAVARLLADARSPRRRPHLHHRQGGAGRQGQQPPRPSRPPGHPGAPRAGRRRVRAAHRGRQVPLRHRRLRDHPGDRDAAQPVPGRRLRRGASPAQRGLRHHRRPRRAERAALDLHRQPPRARRGRDDQPRRPLRRRARHPGRRRPGGPGARPAGAHHVRVRSRPGCSTPSSGTTRSAA